MVLTKDYLEKVSDAKLFQTRNKLWRKLTESKILAIATLQKRKHCCRKPGCRCMDKKKPQLHGPYVYLAHRGGEKPGMLVLGKNQEKIARKMIENYNSAWNDLCTISCINIELLKRKLLSTLK